MPRAQRRVLHAKCETLGSLTHRTRGGEDGGSPDRRFCFQRRVVFSPVLASIGDDAIGCLVQFGDSSVRRSSRLNDKTGRGVVTGFFRGSSSLDDDDDAVTAALAAAATVTPPKWEIVFESGGSKIISLHELNVGLEARWFTVSSKLYQRARKEGCKL